MGEQHPEAVEQQPEAVEQQPEEVEQEPEEVEQQPEVADHAVEGHTVQEAPMVEEEQTQLVIVPEIGSQELFPTGLQYQR